MRPLRSCLCSYRRRDCTFELDFTPSSAPLGEEDGGFAPEVGSPHQIVQRITMTQKTPITVAYGDGIRPALMRATLDVITAAGAQLNIEEIEIGEKVSLSDNPSGIAPSA